MGEFGNKFRQAREKKEISLDDVSSVTKISARMLQAIEEERFDQLPGGVFNKGFIRAYAKHLGLNAEEAVTDYLACLRQAQIDAHEVWEPESSSMPRPAQPRPDPTPGKAFRAPAKLAETPAARSDSPVQVEDLPDLQLPRVEHVRPPQESFAPGAKFEIPWRIVAISAVVLVLAVILWTRRSHNPPTASASSGSTPSQAAPAVPAAGNPNPTSSAVASASTAAPLAASNTASQQRNAPSAASSPDPAGNVEKTEKSDVTVHNLQPVVSQPSVKAAPQLSLVIRATETSWISILADGQSVSQETLIAPAHASVRANREIVARIGNAAGVTFIWKGQEISAAGAEAEVKTFVFDANGMRELPSNQPFPNH